DVRGRPPELAAATHSTHDIAVEIERTAEELRRGLHSSLESELADLRRRHHKAVDGDGGHYVQTHSALLERGAERRDRAAPTAPISEVVADDDFCDSHAEEQIDEAIRLGLRERAIERLDDEVVDRRVGEQLALARRRADERRGVIRREQPR